MSRREQGVERPPPRLFSLTREQARLLREGANQLGGVFLGLCRSDLGLFDGGCAEPRHEPTWHDTPKRDHSGPIGWLWEMFLVPTSYGLDLLAAAEARDVAERSRRGY